MKTRFLLPACLILASACATVPPDSASAEAVDSISFETGPCFGACPVYRVTVNADGSGTFEGRRFTTVTGTRSFRVTPEQYRAFARHLAPLRPREGDVRYSGEACEMMATDLPSTEVGWTSGGAHQSLYFYHGCDMEKNRAIAERLNAAADLLPIRELVGAR